MEYVRIRNWEKYQHYSQRNPPWIKLHNRMLDDYDYGCLPDSGKLLLITLFMLASRTDNNIPTDPEWIRSKGMLKGKIDLDPLIKAKFIEHVADCNQNASTMLADCKQNGGTEERRDRDREEERQMRLRALFEKLWSEYPKKKSKGDAEKAFNAIKPDEQLVETMISTIRRAKTSDDWSKEGGKYIPYPATWLRARGWEDQETEIHEESEIEKWKRLHSPMP
jgi:hypothetical protein